jgi:hypothetical protein
MVLLDFTLILISLKIDRTTLLTKVNRQVEFTTRTKAMDKWGKFTVITGGEGRKSAELEKRAEIELRALSFSDQLGATCSLPRL